MSVLGTLCKMSLHKCPELMAEIKVLVPWLHEHKILLEVVYIRSEANLADVPSRQRGLDMWSLQQPTQQELLYLVEVTLGTQVCTDPFAFRQRSVTPRYATPLHCRHSAAFNGVYSSTGRRCSLCGSTRPGISYRKFWKKFDRQGQEVS